MLTPEEFEVILERIRTNSATDADLAALQRSLKRDGEVVQIGLQQQGRFNINIGNVEGKEIQFGDRIYNGADAETIRRIFRELLGVAELLPPSLEEQREAVCQFLQSTYERFSSVEFLHRRGQKVALRDQYIPIQVTLDKQPEKSSAGRYLGYVESEAELQRAYALKREDDKREQIDWQEAKKKHQRVIVLADPGMGKTTLLRMEAGTLAQQEQQALLDGSKTLEMVKLPVWLRLSNLAEQVQEATDTVLEAILKLVKAEWDEEEFAKLEPTLKDKLKKGQCLLLLDALDEVPRQLRDRLTEKLNDFARNYACPIICTSRIVGYTSFLNGATEVEIVPFNQQQTKIYLEKWFINATDVLDKTVSAKELIQELQSKPQIQGLATNPLMLSLICSLYQEQGIALPARRCEVYAKAVEYMLGKWSRSSRKHTGAKLQAKTRLLEYLAYQFTCDGVEIFSEDQLYIKLSEYLEDSKIPAIFRKFETDDPIEELAAEDGILQKLSEKEYLFFHRTFQEYFTASYLVRTGEEGIQLVKSHLWNFEWHETISLVAGLMDTPLILIQEITKEKDDIFQTQLMLVGRCIAECQISYFLVDYIVDQIYKFWKKNLYAEFIQVVIVAIGKNFAKFTETLLTDLKTNDLYTREKIFKALAEIRTKEVIYALTSKLNQQDTDNHSRRHTVEALGKTGSDEAVHALTVALDNDDIRQYAAEALRRIGSEEAITALVESLNKDGVVRFYVVEALSKIDHEKIGVGKATDVLILIFDTLIATWKNKELIDVLSSNHLELLQNIALSLGRIGTEKAIIALLSAFKDKDRNVRAIVAEVFRRISRENITEKIVEALILALNDEYYFVRSKAAEALGKIGTEQTTKALVGHLNDENDYVRRSVGKALEKTTGSKDIASLTPHDLIEDRMDRESIAALNRIGGSKTIDVLISELSNADPAVRRNTVRVLRRIGNNEAINALIVALEDPDSSVRKTVVQALSEFSDYETVLINLLQSSNLDIFRNDVFLLARQLTIQSNRKGIGYVPVYPERVKSLT